MKHSFANGLHGSYARMHTWIKLNYWKKRSKNQKGIVDKLLDYKCRNKIANETQMNMVNAITSLTSVMKEILKVCDKSKEPLFPKQNSDAHNKEDAQYVFIMYIIL